MKNHYKIYISILYYFFLISIIVIFIYIVHTNHIIDQIKYVDKNWIAVYFILSFASFIFRAYRLKILLYSVGKFNVYLLFYINSFSLLLNQIIPFHGGEVAKIGMLYNYKQVSINNYALIILFERLVELVVFVGLTGIVVVVVFLSGDLNTNFSIIMSYINVKALVVVLFGLLLILLFVFQIDTLKLVFQQSLINKYNSIYIKVYTLLLDISNCLQLIKKHPVIFITTCYTGCMLLCMTLALYALIRSFGYDPQWYSTLFVLFIVMVGTVVLIAPGNVGQFHFFMILALGLFEKDLARETATGIAIIAHSGNLLLLLVLTVVSFALHHIRAKYYGPDDVSNQ